MTTKVASMLLTWLGVVMSSSIHLVAAPKDKLPSYCPPPGAVVQLSKATNPSFQRDFRDCDIVVEVVFLKMGTPQGFRLAGYDTKKNTTFQVMEPGTAPQSAFGQTVGTFVGTPKANSDFLFQIKEGEVLLLRGSPIRLATVFGLASISATIFHASSVIRK